VDAAQAIRRQVMGEHMAMLSMLKAGEIQRLTDTGWWMREVRTGKRLQRYIGRQRNPSWTARPQRRVTERKAT
jgi:hypothetical protein